MTLILNGREIPDDSLVKRAFDLLQTFDEDSVEHKDWYANEFADLIDKMLSELASRGWIV